MTGQDRQQQIEARRDQVFEREEIMALAGSLDLGDRVKARKRIEALQVDAARLSGLQDTLAKLERLLDPLQPLDELVIEEAYQLVRAALAPNTDGEATER